MSRMPVLFVSHGSPMMALEPGAAGEAFGRLGKSLPRPEAILAVSAHWDQSAPTLSAADHPETIHDFYGFPAPLFALRYPAPGAPALAKRAAELLAAAGQNPRVHPSHGLDHGAWSPLRFIYPEADIPVTQLAIQSRLGAAHHFNLGRALRALRDEGVLILGSGSLTHNLNEFRGGAQDAGVEPYVREFQAWVQERIAAGDTEALNDYRRRAPHAVRAHPSEEHFVPLHVALGAADDIAGARRITDSVDYRILAMDSYVFDPVNASGEVRRAA